MTKKLSIFGSPHIYLRRKCTYSSPRVENTLSARFSSSGRPVFTISVLGSQHSFSSVCESAEHSSASYTLVGLKAMEKGKGEKQQGESSDFLSHNTELNSTGHLGWFGCELKAPDPQSSLILCWPGGEFGNKGQDSSSSSHQERIVTRPHWAEASADTHCGFDSAYLPLSHPPISRSPPPPPPALSPEWSAHSKSPTEVEMIGSPVFID